tara:strand:- start:106 stop:690 length:585 start_codon:yes stop_codon:yes gene_type:complete
LRKQNLKTKPSTGIGPVIFDLETNGLLHDATQIHCVVLHYLDTNETFSFNDESPGKGLSEPVVRAVQYLEIADCIIGHNVLGFDIPIINSIYPFFNPTGNIIDTLLLSRLYHPNLLDIDKKHAWKHMPLQLYGRHSLESYGYRLGEYKGNFGKNTDWKNWSQEMEDYCAQDVTVTTKLWKHFLPYLNGSKWSTK